MTKILHTRTSDVGIWHHVFDKKNMMAYALAEDTGDYFESFCAELPRTDREWNVLDGWTLKLTGDRGREAFAKVSK